MDAGEFLIELWGERPPGQVLVWRLPSKRSTWYFDLTKVKVEGYTDDDVYFGVGLAAPGVKLKVTQRVTADKVHAIAALWNEIDIKGPAHQKENLPTTFEEAYELLDRMPLAPTIVVNSGHGLQAWWLLEEPWVFSTPAVRKQAAEIAKWWNGVLKQLASESGWDIDATHDLARVMRLPGTFNHKADDVVPVTVERQDGPRYSLAEIQAMYSSVGMIQLPEDVHAWEGEHIELGKAEFPFMMWEALMENDPKFKRSWNRNRPDLIDQSQSSYDMSLATLASNAGWNAVDVAAMLRTHREKYGSSDDPKLQRTDYYERTIERATTVMTEAEAKITVGLEEGDSAKALEGLSEMFGIGEIRIKKFLGTPHTYRMESPAGDVTIGVIDNITNQRKFRNAVADATRVWIEGVDKAVWDKKVVKAILEALEEVDTGEASHPVHLITGWVFEYLHGKTVHTQWEDGFEVNEPFIKEGKTFLRLQELKLFLITKGERLTVNDMAQFLQIFGARPRRLNGHVGGRRTSKFYWELPEEAHE